MVQPDPRREKFQAIEERAGQADSCLLARPTRPGYRAPRCSGRDGCCLRLRPQTRLVARRREARTPRFRRTLKKCSAKTGEGPAFPDDELVYGTRSNVRIFAGAGTPPTPREFYDIGVT